MSYVGELGWELYVPTDFAEYVFDAIRAEGANHGLELAGYYTLNSLRFEKGYRHWGHDITSDDTPVESGLSFAVAWDKSASFTGRAALVAQRETGATTRLIQIKLLQNDNADAALVHHNEPILRDGQPVGYVTGGMWGHSVGAAIGMATVKHTEPIKLAWLQEGEWAVELPGRNIQLEVQFRPWL